MHNVVQLAYSQNRNHVDDIEPLRYRSCYALAAYMSFGADQDHIQM